MKPVALAVEDGTVIRMLASDALVGAGFAVIEADHDPQAFDVPWRQAQGIHAVSTNVHKTGAMGGVALAYEASRCWPSLRLVVASGHAMPTGKNCRRIVVSCPNLFHCGMSCSSCTN